MLVKKVPDSERTRGGGGVVWLKILLITNLLQTLFMYKWFETFFDMNKCNKCKNILSEKS